MDKCVDAGLFELLRPTSERLRTKGRILDCSEAVSHQAISPGKEFLSDVPASTELRINASISVLLVDGISHDMEVHVAEFAGTIKTAQLWNRMHSLRLVRVRKESGRVDEKTEPISPTKP